MNNLNFFIKWIVVLQTVGILMGCSSSKSTESDEYLIRVGDQVVTVLDFNKAFEIAKAAYPHNIMQKPVAFKEARIRLLNQMTEELIILERARELNISVSDEEIEKTIADIKSDYPDNVFEETLLEYAVSYESWKKGLKTRLLMEKLVEKELKDLIVITAEDIEKFYQKNYKSNDLHTEFAENSEDINEMIIKHLRRKKTENAYKSWIEQIQKNYKIEINQKQWEKIISS